MAAEVGRARSPVWLATIVLDRSKEANGRDADLFEVHRVWRNGTRWEATAKALDALEGCGVASRSMAMMAMAARGRIEATGELRS